MRERIKNVVSQKELWREEIQKVWREIERDKERGREDTKGLLGEI